MSIENAALFCHFAAISALQILFEQFLMVLFVNDFKKRTYDDFDELISVYTHKVNGTVWIRLHSMLLHSICPSGWICSLH